MDGKERKKFEKELPLVPGGGRHASHNTSELMAMMGARPGPRAPQRPRDAEAVTDGG